jgi:hypothetical protein
MKQASSRRSTLQERMPQLLRAFDASMSQRLDVLNVPHVTFRVPHHSPPLQRKCSFCLLKQLLKQLLGCLTCHWTGLGTLCPAPK